MARYILIAINGPTAGEGDEQDYNDWYRDVHIADLLATPGVESAKRFRVVMSKHDLPPYLALYEIETDDLQQVLDHMVEHNRPFPATFDGKNSEFITAVAVDE